MYNFLINNYYIYVEHSNTNKKILYNSNINNNNLNFIILFKFRNYKL